MEFVPDPEPSLERVIGSQAELEAIKQPAETPPFWPTSYLKELEMAGMIREAIDLDPGKIDIYNANSVADHGALLQTLGGNGAELMARMRMILEEERGKAIIEAMVDEKIEFKRMSATLQNKYVDSKIAIYHAAFMYVEYLNKRVSYQMDYVRSLLSFRKEEMYLNRPISQQQRDHQS